MTATRAILASAAPARADRAAAALAAMTAPSAAAGEKDLSLSGYAKLWLRGEEGRGGSLLTEPASPFEQSLWFNACVRKVMITGKGIPLAFLKAAPDQGVRAKSRRADIRPSRRRSLRPWRGRRAVCLGRAAEGDRVDAGPALDLFERPNRFQDWPAFLEATIGYLYTSGSAAWLLADLVGARPGAMYVLDGRRVEPKFDRDEQAMPVLLGYVYRTPDGAEVGLGTDELKYFCFWSGDERNPLRGLAPGTPGRFALATDYGASMFNAAALSNGIAPGAHVDFPGGFLSDEQRDEFVARVRAEHGGPSKAGRILITAGGAKLEPWNSTFTDLQFDKGLERTRLEICALTDVPPAVAGFSGFTGDSSAMLAESMQMFYEFCVLPLLDGFAPAVQDVTDRIQPGLVAYFDVEDQPVVQKMRLSRVEAAERLHRLTYPVNDINRALDLGMPDLAWGDVGWVGTGLLPAAEMAAAPIAPPEGEPPPPPDADEIGQAEGVAAAKPGDERSKSPGQREKGRAERNARLWWAWNNSWRGLARRATAALRLHYARQEKGLVKALETALSAAGYDPEKRAAGPDGAAVKAGPYEPIVDRVLVEVIGDPKSAERLRARVRSAMQDGQELGLRQALSEAGLSGDALAEAVRRLMTNPRLTAALAAESTLISAKIDAWTRRHLRHSLAEGLDRGETIRKLTGRVQAYMGNRRAAAETVARNTVAQAMSRSRHEGQREAGVTHKFWIQSAGPGDRRASHRLAAAEYAEARAIRHAEPYVIHREDGRGDVMLAYPRDASAGCPGETVNCQCLSVGCRAADLDEARRLLSALAARARFVTYEEMLAARQAA